MTRRLVSVNPSDPSIAALPTRTTIGSASTVVVTPATNHSPEARASLIARQRTRIEPGRPYPRRWSARRGTRALRRARLRR